jgi:hypothetical protein
MFAGSNAAKAEWSRFPADLRRDGGANLRVCEDGHGRGSLFPPVIYRDAGNFSVRDANARRLAAARSQTLPVVSYSAIVFTTLEVGRVSVGAPPVALTTLSTCSS